MTRAVNLYVLSTIGMIEITGYIVIALKLQHFIQIYKAEITQPAIIYQMLPLLRTYISATWYSRRAVLTTTPEVVFLVFQTHWQTYRMDMMWPIRWRWWKNISRCSCLAYSQHHLCLRMSLTLFSVIDNRLKGTQSREL